MSDNSNLLSIRNLVVTVEEEKQLKFLVEDVDLDIKERTISALVGSSGSGKTTTGLAILRLLALALKIERGIISFQGEDLLTFNNKKMQQLRGKEIGMVFQEPLNAFNPVFTIGFQINEVLKYHTKISRKGRKERILEILDIVGMPDPRRVAKNYPHQLSGGMRQRAMIAQAIAADPKLLIADEPTSNLDVTLQARIIELFQELKVKLGLSILLITHDLGMVSHVSDEVNVMSKGRIVESGLTKDIIENPKHEYTIKLMEAMNL